MPRRLLSLTGDHTLGGSNCQSGRLAVPPCRAACSRCGNEARAGGLRAGPFEAREPNPPGAASPGLMTICALVARDAGKIPAIRPIPGWARRRPWLSESERCEQVAAMQAFPGRS